MKMGCTVLLVYVLEGLPCMHATACYRSPPPPPQPKKKKKKKKKKKTDRDEIRLEKRLVHPGSSARASVPWVTLKGSPPDASPFLALGCGPALGTGLRT
eukprot:jgi/Botrbrau1/9158/Bobra.160_3s0030.1